MRYFLCIFLLNYSLAYGQATFNGGLIAQVNFAKKWETGWKLNSKLESRAFLVDEINYDRSDLELLLSKSTLRGWHPGVGTLIRYQDPNFRLRTIQQLSNSKELVLFTINHRIRTDQTFNYNSNPVFRLRYRFTAQKNLNGERLDNREFYLKAALEVIGLYFNSTDLECRQAIFIGYQGTNKIKLEAGFDNRVSNLILQDISNQLWLNLALFYTL